ncbi:DUF6292 family protein [Amycolatopsis speibonae]|uniref:DUF6292 family protein n=1 Tax=Amycolatopsis speibonae TaxID=1450224 RepID=A0ABV7P4D9_9PSEU
MLSHRVCPCHAKDTDVSGEDVALVWDEKPGWAVALEINSGFELVTVRYLAGDVLAAPGVVGR